MGWVDLTRECIAELIGTLILCAFGNASLAVFILEPKMSSSLSVHFSWGMGESLKRHISKCPITWGISAISVTHLADPSNLTSKSSCNIIFTINLHLPILSSKSTVASNWLQTLIGFKIIKTKSGPKWLSKTGQRVAWVKSERFWTLHELEFLRCLFRSLRLKINLWRSYQPCCYDNSDNFGRFSAEKTRSICCITNNWCISEFMSCIFGLYRYGADWSKCKNICNLSTWWRFDWASTWNIDHWNLSNGTFYLRCQWCKEFIKTNFQSRIVWTIS